MEKELPTFVIVRHLLSIMLLMIYLLPVVHPANSIGYVMSSADTAVHAIACDECSHPGPSQKKTHTHKQHKQVNLRTHSIAISFVSTGPAASFYSTLAVSADLHHRVPLSEPVYLFDVSSSIWQPPRLIA